MLQHAHDLLFELRTWLSISDLQMKVIAGLMFFAAMTIILVFLMVYFIGPSAKEPEDKKEAAEDAAKKE
jgi:hypothetical protein